MKFHVYLSLCLFLCLLTYGCSAGRSQTLLAKGEQSSLLRLMGPNGKYVTDARVQLYPSLNLLQYDSLTGAYLGIFREDEDSLVVIEHPRYERFCYLVHDLRDYVSADSVTLRLSESRNEYYYTASRRTPCKVLSGCIYVWVRDPMLVDEVIGYSERIGLRVLDKLEVQAMSGTPYQLLSHTGWPGANEVYLMKRYGGEFDRWDSKELKLLRERFPSAEIRSIVGRVASEITYDNDFIVDFKEGISRETAEVTAHRFRLRLTEISGRATAFNQYRLVAPTATGSGLWEYAVALYGTGIVKAIHYECCS